MMRNRTMLRLLQLGVIDMLLYTASAAEATEDGSATINESYLSLETVSSKLEQLWAQETQAAQNEFDRLLQGLHSDGMSFPPPPTSSPLSTPPSSPSTFPPTMDDGCLFGRTPEQFLLDTLLEITNVNELLDPTRPQGMAFNFMLSDPLVLADVCTYPSIEQRYGLAVLFYATTGDSWTTSTNWLGNTNECQWFGIDCADGILASNLTLSSNNLVGTIPNEISTLYQVDGMQLFDNNITGPIPSGLANLTLLELIDLERNQLTGPAFSDTILSLSNVKQLFLSNNNLTGTIPSALSTSLNQLTDFWAAGNNLIGPLPALIGTLTGLETLILYSNKLDGALPSTLGGLTGLKNLQLYQNIFDRPIPDELFQLSQLNVLRLDQNFLTGSLPDQIGELTALTDLRIQSNFIGSTLPETFFNLNQLQILTAGTNLFSGPIPNVFVGFAALQDLDLSTCFFTGPIPDTLFDNLALERVYFNNNGLTGSIPANYGNSPALEDLLLDNNQLNGPVPPATSLGNLREFTLQNNLFTGTMPSSVCALRATSLELLFSDCGGATPEIVCSFPDCCNRCFEGGVITDQQRRNLLIQQKLLQQFRTGAIHDVDDTLDTIKIDGDRAEVAVAP